MFARIVCAIGLLAWAAGCGGNETVSVPVEGGLSSVDFALAADANFANHSVKICGQRAVPADPIYPCDSGYPVPTCHCFAFDADGTLAGDAFFDELCPSTNSPVGSWTFEYFIWSQPNCEYGGGVLLSAPPATQGAYDYNLVCYDAANVYSHEDPNLSTEALMPGDNSNDIICLTRDADKEWTFDVCLDETSAAEYGYGTMRLDCNCEPAMVPYCVPPPPPSCTCPFDPAVLPSGCEVRPNENCDIVCTSTPPV